jgi:predicted metalloprotease with PDZ domain
MKSGFLAVSLLLAASTPLPVAGQETSASSVAPQLTVVLIPRLRDGKIATIDGTMTLSGLRLAAGQELVQMGLLVASIPTVRYDGDALTARDTQGILPLTIEDGKPGPFGASRHWRVARATQGPIVLSFTAVPRKVDANTRPGPLFDLRAEAGGVNGAGLSFLPLPQEGNFAIRLHWDLRELPSGALAVSTYGEGDVALSGSAQQLAGAYYTVGPVQTAPAVAAERQRFGAYWLTPTPFDMKTVGTMIERLYLYESKFFQDGGGAFRVFVRRNPYPRGGGTAQGRSFMFGWNEGYPQTTDDLEDLLAHEMTHTWPLLEGEHADTSWYSEGNAEYYSILLSWRAGIITDAQFLDRINHRALAYYINPRQSLTNRQAEEIYWSDVNASHVPYGRGFLYLATVDAKIRQRSGGKRSLDNIVVALSKRRQNGDKVGVEDWLKAVEQELGPGARADYDAMATGRTLLPVDGGFGRCFKLERFIAPTFALGFDQASLEGQRKVIKGLIPNSAAARAGLRNGDVVLESNSIDDAARSRSVTVTIQRGDAAPIRVAYSGDGAPVTAYRWAWRTPRPSGACVQRPTVPIG